MIALIGFLFSITSNAGTFVITEFNNDNLVICDLDSSNCKTLNTDAFAKLVSGKAMASILVNKVIPSKIMLKIDQNLQNNCTSKIDHSPIFDNDIMAKRDGGVIIDGG